MTICRCPTVYLIRKPLCLFYQTHPHPHCSASLPPDAARLWDRWFKHALLLKERRVLSTKRLVQLFTPLLLERHATYSHQVALEARTIPLHIQIGGHAHLHSLALRAHKHTHMTTGVKWLPFSSFLKGQCFCFFACFFRRELQLVLSALFVSGV